MLTTKEMTKNHDRQEKLGRKHRGFPQTEVKISKLAHRKQGDVFLALLDYDNFILPARDIC